MEKTEGKIRYGLIGIGAQGGSYARFLTNAPAPFPGMVCAPCPDNCALGALCDIDPEKEKMCKEQYPDVPFFKDWKDMIASGTVDAIITTVPHYLHHEISIYAMEHGMNVLCEKPAGVRSKDVQKMIACAKAHPEVSFGIMFNQRTNKLYQKIKEIVASGELGEIRRSQWMINSWWRPDSYYQQSAWRATWGGEGGGVLVNQAPHQLDLWQWICGIPVKVFSKNINGCHRDIGVENDVTMLVEFANGATGTFTTCTHDAIGTDRLEIDLDGVRIGADLKTISMWNIKQEGLRAKLHREIIDRDYHLSAAMYCETAGLDQFFWIFVNKDENYHWIAIIEASAELLELGMLEYRKAMRAIATPPPGSSVSSRKPSCLRTRRRPGSAASRAPIRSTAATIRGSTPTGRPSSMPTR